MAITASTLDDAANGLLESALLGNDWREPLALFASRAGALGATLVRDQPRHSLLSQPRSEFVLATQSIAEAVEDYLDGDIPPDPRSTRVSPRREDGFVTDFDQFSHGEICQSPFYEEFLRPRNVRWHACAHLDGSRDHGELYLSLKRSVRQEHYSKREIGLINSTLPKLHMAAAMARAILRAERQGQNVLSDRRGEALLEFDANGRVLTFNQLANSLIGVTLHLVQRRLVAPLHEDGAKLEHALAAPFDHPPRVACVVLNTPVPGRRLVFRTFPIMGDARDIFSAGGALAAVTVWEKPRTLPTGLARLLHEAFGLTKAEAHVTALVGRGVTLSATSEILSISRGTARNYLKAGQAKIGLSRQAELAGLVEQMRIKGSVRH